MITPVHDGIEYNLYTRAATLRIYFDENKHKNQGF